MTTRAGRVYASSPIDVVNLGPLMARIAEMPEVRIGLIDVPVALGHPDLVGGNIHQIFGGLCGGDAQVNSTARTHGTFVAGMLSASGGSAAPAICPDCTLPVRPIFGTFRARTVGRIQLRSTSSVWM